MTGDGQRTASGEAREAAPSCPACGGATPAGARFCPWCGTAVEPTGGHTRKMVTVVFSDLVGFTPLGEALEPEALREVMQRFYDLAARAVGAHGGRVASFAGDAVMAVFGVPALHEDDPLRAVRAALELGSGLEALNAEIARGWGVRLAARTGVNTGEVVAGDGSLGALVGDAVNVAARLEQAAAAGEILVADATLRRVREHVRAEPVPPLALKGKREPVAAWRLAGLRDPGDHDRDAARPLVDRVEEMAMLRAELARVRAGGAPRVVTLLGAPGIGKSRIADAFAASAAGDATVLRGRCPSYGEGLTLAPLREIGALRETGADAPLDEMFAALRGLVRRVSGEGPALVVIEDLHWAEPSLLDLFDRVWAEPSSGPVLAGGDGAPRAGGRPARLGSRPRARRAHTGRPRGRRRRDAGRRLPRRRPRRRGGARAGGRGGRPATRSSWSRWSRCWPSSRTRRCARRASRRCWPPASTACPATNASWPSGRRSSASSSRARPSARWPTG